MSSSADHRKPGRLRLLQPAKSGALRHEALHARLDGLRGMAWAYSVLHHTGLSASKASLVFSSRANPDAATSNIMYQYLRGDRAPTQGGRGKFGFDLVKEVDSDPDGSNATPWLSHPFWEIFAEEISMDQLTDYTAMVPAHLAACLLVQSPPSDPLDLDAQWGAPNINSLDEFVCLCANFRAALKAGYWPHGYWQLLHAAERAALLDPVFGYIKVPFLEMVQRFFAEPAEKAKCSRLRGCSIATGN